MPKQIFTDLFGSLDLSQLHSLQFKEDSVREEIILPMLHALGYSPKGLNLIVRSKTLEHPFVNIGSNRHHITMIPDYLMVVRTKPAWILDAKAPEEQIVTGENVEQAYSYAIHPDVRVRIYALCNGREFIAFDIEVNNPIIYFQLSEIDKYWDQFYAILSPGAFALSSPSELQKEAGPHSTFDYSNIKPLPEIKDLMKQSAKRHFGVHPYFTKQVWNVVQEYVKNFTCPGDLVLDPYGGSGVTLVESLILGRKAIQVDINPLANFIVENLIAPIDINLLRKEYEHIQTQFEKHSPKTESEIEDALTKYDYPKNVVLPKNSDVPTLDKLFSPVQLAQLAYLKHLIKQVKDDSIRNTLLLMFSGLLNKINLTYHASSVRSEGGGDSAAFRYYRYRLAPEPAQLDMMRYFDSRLRKIIGAKKEIAPFIDSTTVKNATIVKGTATNLSFINDQSVDYIYTDPPYGSKIQYLDLSIMWNSWLDLPVTQEDYAQEAIEGGELEKTRDDYSKLLAKSIEEMYRVLKFERWMSFVFAHKDPAYWHLIVETAEKSGFEYMGAVRQSNDKTTFKKRQNPFTVLSGQLIINFKKAKNPKSIMKVDLGVDVASIIIETIEGVIAQNNGATLEEINDELIIKGLELGFLHVLGKQYKDISPILMENFNYDDSTKKYHIIPDSKFKSLIDINLRVRYYLLSYMRRIEHQQYNPTFDDIVLNIMPLLKNGITPEKQTILNVLQQIAVRTDDGHWKLADRPQLNLL